MVGATPPFATISYKKYIMDPVTAIATLVTSVVSRIWPDATEKKKQDFTLEITRELNASNLILKQLEADNKQTDVNIEQAKNTNLFVSGPRPYIMWGLGTILILYAALSTFVALGVALQYHIIPMPPMDPMMRDIILGLLGLGYLTRSYDKKYGK